MHAPNRDLFKRTIFVSLPSQNPALARFVQQDMAPAVNRTYTKLRVVSYLDFVQQGDFRELVRSHISGCNATVAFLDGYNPNVLIEIGRAAALGKPCITVAPEGGQDLPAMISHELTIRYKRNFSKKGKKSHREYDPPPAETLKQIIEAIDQVVMRPTARERSDRRSEMQKRLIAGNKKARSGAPEVELAKGVRQQELLRAEECYREGDFDKAIALLRKIRHKSEQVLHLIADCSFLQGEYAATEYEARQCYQLFLQDSVRGRRQHPKSRILKKDYGNALIKNGRYSEARKIFGDLLKETREHNYLYNLACAHCLEGEWHECLRYLDEAIAADPYYQTLARMDPDFDSIWENEMFQALVFQRRLGSGNAGPWPLRDSAPSSIPSPGGGQ